MKIAFRVDASIEIGTGHVMRCLTLADELARQGCLCIFICRDHRGHLGSLIRDKGYDLYLLSEPGVDCVDLNWNDHARWLGTSWEEDAAQTMEIIGRVSVDRLVVDHYALDIYWERRILQRVDQLMVIDDLADRRHQCNILLDQTYGRKSEDYDSFVPDGCNLLCGTDYALLRPEFSRWRKHSIVRRRNSKVERLLINMGGVDKDNITGKVLVRLQECDLPEECSVVIVMGVTAPWLEEVKQQARRLPWKTEVRVNVTNMAELMSTCDLAIGAAGATSWERCCLGLPSILITIAENQKTISDNMRRAGAAVCFSDQNALVSLKEVIKTIDLELLSHNASKVCDGFGASYVAQQLVGSNNGTS